MKVKSLGRVQLLATPWTAAHQAPSSQAWDFPGKSAGVGAIAFSGQLSNDTETIRCCLVAGVQPRWIQGDSKVGTESVSLEKYIFNHRNREIRNG